MSKEAEKQIETSVRWIPLESNPEVFNSWAKKAGLITAQARFVDVYGLDEEMLSFVPQPVTAVVLLFPIDPEGEAKRQAEDELVSEKGQPKLDSTIFWVKQTISNACGTIGLIHALANSGVSFTPMSPLQKYIIDCQEKTPDERARLLSSTPLFGTIHAESAAGGQTKATEEDMMTELHFTCFVQAPEADLRTAALDGEERREEFMNREGEATGGTGMRLIELDGRRKGPVDHGECKDLLRDAAIAIKARYVSTTSSVNFNLMALTTSPEGE